MRFFLIDRVTEIVPAERARGIKAVTLTDEVLHDHFPDYPVLPGALIVEGAAQLAGFLLEATVNRAGEPPLRALLTQIRDARFYEPCTPGDRLDFTVTIESRLEGAAQVAAEVRVDEKRVARAGLTFVLKRIDSERVHEQRRYLYRLWTRDLTPPIEIF